MDITRPHRSLLVKCLTALVMGVIMGGAMITMLVAAGFFSAIAIGLIVMGFRLGWPF